MKLRLLVHVDVYVEKPGDYYDRAYTTVTSQSTYSINNTMSIRLTKPATQHRITFTA